MDVKIDGLKEADLPELRNFLVKGFELSPNAECVLPEVLHWKYFDPMGDFSFPRAFVARVAGQIVACVGICPTRFVFGSSLRQIPAAHGIDWLASKIGVPVGLMVSECINNCTDVEFAIGGTPQAIAIKRKLRWKFPIQIPEFQRVLRPSYRLRKPTIDPLWKALLKTVRDCGRAVLHPIQQPKQLLELRQVSSFGEEIERITKLCPVDEIYTQRTAELLNHYLRYPKKNISGWLLVEKGESRGFALLSIVQHESHRVGKIADCFMDCLDVALWQAALHALTGQLKKQGADVVVCYGTTPWMANALEDNGFRCQRLLPLSLRDPRNLIPDDASFYLTHLEADHAYL